VPSATTPWSRHSQRSSPTTPYDLPTSTWPTCVGCRGGHRSSQPGCRHSGRGSVGDRFLAGMIDYLKGKTNAQGIRNVQAVVMDGQALDVAGNTFDAAFSIFGLMFFPDRAAGFRELYRAIRSKGLAVVTSWSTIERLRFAQRFSARSERLSRPPAPQKPPPWLSLADRSAFKAEMHAWASLTSTCLASCTCGRSPIRKLSSRRCQVCHRPFTSILVPYNQPSEKRFGRLFFVGYEVNKGPAVWTGGRSTHRCGNQVGRRRRGKACVVDDRPRRAFGIREVRASYLLVFAHVEAIVAVRRPVDLPEWPAVRRTRVKVPSPSVESCLNSPRRPVS
jgi:SAM-dependent methyltransferase